MTHDSAGTFVDLDDVLKSLQDVARELDVSSDFGERIRLRERQRELRTIAARLRKRVRVPAEVARELNYLERLRDKILDGHVSVGHVGGGNGPGGGGIEPRDVFAMNEAIDQAWDRAGVEERIQRQRAELRKSEQADEPS